MDPIALSLIVGAIAFFLGAWRGWQACNHRWMDAANKGEPIRIDDGDYFVFTETERWEPTDPPDVLSSE